VAADLVDAIETVDLGRKNGWDLEGWSYHLVPWGVCFTHRDLSRGVRSEITVRLSLPLPLKATTASRFTRDCDGELPHAAARAYAQALEA